MGDFQSAIDIGYQEIIDRRKEDQKRTEQALVDERELNLDVVDRCLDNLRKYMSHIRKLKPLDGNKAYRLRIDTGKLMRSSSLGNDYSKIIEEEESKSS